MCEQVWMGWDPPGEAPAHGHAQPVLLGIPWPSWSDSNTNSSATCRDEHQCPHSEAPVPSLRSVPGLAQGTALGFGSRYVSGASLQLLSAPAWAALGTWAQGWPSRYSAALGSCVESSAKPAGFQCGRKTRLGVFSTPAKSISVSPFLHPH